MDNQQYVKHFSFIWNIANDVLVFAFEKGDYKKIIQPFTVLRRIDVLLEETKAKVLEKKKFCDKNKLPYEQLLSPVTGYPFNNASAFTMATLKNEIDPQRLKMNDPRPSVGMGILYTKFAPSESKLGSPPRGGERKNPPSFNDSQSL